MADFSDLKPRILTALALAMVFGLGLSIGGAFFWALVVVAVGIAIWEQARLLPPDQDGWYFWIGVLAILFSAYGLVAVRNESFVWALWLIAVVILTDIAGYFAGKYFGGRKFWPKISPKKTWSGTAAGWAGAALLSAVFASFMNVGMLFLAVAGILISVSAQMGDILESAIKRRAGVKDSSAILPGHGGVLDRIDGLIGAGFAYSLITSFT